MAFCCVFAFFYCILSFSTPLMINILIRYVKNPDKTWQQGLELLFIILGLKLIFSFITSHQTFSFSYLGVRLENVLNMSLYKKSLKFSLINSKTYNVGELVNYMQVDSQKLRDLPYFIGGVVFLPIQIGLAIFIMYEVIGISFLAGIGALIVTFVFNFLIGKYFTVFQKGLLGAKDARMKLANEILSSIKVIKVNAWEKFFLDKISELREKELSWLRKSITTSVCMIFSLYLTPQLILGATFTMYTLMDNPMTPERVFTLVSTFVVLQNSIRFLPLAIAFVLQSYVSIKRIEKFLLAEEIDDSFINKEIDVMEMAENAVVLKNGYFYWDQEEKKNDKNQDSNNSQVVENVRNFSIDLKNDPIKINQDEKNELNYSYLSKESVLSSSKFQLKNLNLKIKKGSLTAIIGE